MEIKEGMQLNHLQSYNNHNHIRNMGNKHLSKYSITTTIRISWIIWLLFLGLSLSTVDGRVQQLSACKAKVENRVLNLEPLQRRDGMPRFKTEVNNTWYYYNPCAPFNFPKDDPHKGGGDHCYFVAMCKSMSDSTESSSQNYYTVGIQSSAKFMIKPFNSVKIPTKILELFKSRYPGFLKNAIDKDSSESEEIHPAKILQNSHENNVLNNEDSHENLEETETDDNTHSNKNPVLFNKTLHTLHLPVNSNESGNSSQSLNSTSEMEDSIEDAGDSSFSSSEELLAKITYISFKGVRSYKNSKAFIYLLCDHARQKANDAIFDFIDVPNTLDKHFILQHQCSCPDGCPRFDFPYFNENDQNETDGMLHSQSSSEENLPKHMWLIVVINGGILTIAVLIGGVFCRKGGSGNGAYYNMLPAIHSSRLTMGASAESLFMAKSKLHRPEYLEYSSALTKAAQLPTISDGQIESRDLEIGQRLGGGLFGDTYLAEWKERKVAAKRVTVNVHQNQMTEEDDQWICKEVIHLSKQKHKHLISYMGMCTDTKQPYVITEFFEGGCFKDMLRRENEGFSWQKKIKLCLQVADGLAFLHSSKFPILHRDLRCSNVLVDQNDRVKVVDYGLTKIVQRLRQKCNGRKGCFCNKDMSAVPGSVRWTAPEVLAFPTADEYNNFDILSTACDVYSYAMLLWEVATSLDPFEDIPDNSEVIEIVISGGRPSLDTIVGTPSYIQELMKKCWSHDPANRPTFKTVAVQMKSSLTLASKEKRHRTTSTTSQYMKSLLSTYE